MDLLQSFIKLFDGYELAYGQHNNFVEDVSGKLNGRATTIPAQLNSEVIKQHLSGSGSSLGIIPLKKNDKCRFGAIDIDNKHAVNPLRHSLIELEDKITSLQLPLVVCQSKSKGAHLFCFTQKDVDAQLLITRLKEWASLLGYGSAEVFPKQYYRVNAQDYGSWINIPYFNYENTQRYAINKHKPLSLDEFLKFAEIMKISEDELINFKIGIDNDVAYSDAPPCLQILSSYGIEEGSRNNGLYNFGVFFKSKYPDTWQDKIMEINGNIIKPALGLKELETIIKSINKKQYFYKCNEYPLCQFCNKTECFKRKYGIGTSSDLEMSFDNLTKYISSDNSVFWYAEYQGKRIQLTTDELLNQRLLQKKLLNSVNKIFQPTKSNKWLEKVEQLLSTCIVIVDPEEASKKGQFKELLDSFLTSGAIGQEKDVLLSDSVYLDESAKIIYFKSSNLFSYLKNKKYMYTEQEVWHWLREEMNADNTQLKIGNKRIRVWYMPAPEIYKAELDGDKLL